MSEGKTDANNNTDWRHTMTNDINNAIARSISHNEIVAVEVANPDQARRQTPGVEGWTQLDDGAIDMWGEDVDGEEWRLRVKLDADAAIAAHFDGWGDATNAPQVSPRSHGTSSTRPAMRSRTARRPVGASWSARWPTRSSKMVPTVTEAQVAAWLEWNRDELIEAVDQEIALRDE